MMERRSEGEGEGGGRGQRSRIGRCGRRKLGDDDGVGFEGCGGDEARNGKRETRGRAGPGEAKRCEVGSSGATKTQMTVM
jgi:hypothetical protein